MNKCDHQRLPRGLKCDRGYLVLTVRYQGRVVPHPGCGPHTPLSETLARKRLAQIREDIILGKYNLEPEIPEKTFEEVVPIYLKHWAAERNGDGTLKHNERSIKETEAAIRRNLIPFFGHMKFHNIRATDVERRRDQRIADGVLGTTVNKEHVPLSSIFGRIERWMELGKIERFKIPAKNPCAAATKAETRSHDKILSDTEMKKLFTACRVLKDPDAAEIIDLLFKSVLSVGDAQKLEIGQTIDTERSKTGVPVSIPITVLCSLNWKNWPTRWKRIRRWAFGDEALDKRSENYVDAKVIRKTGINDIRKKFGIEAASNYAGHASIKTTEQIYKVLQEDENRPAAEYMARRVKELRGEGSNADDNGNPSA